jgi:hypothetical protein
MDDSGKCPIDLKRDCERITRKGREVEMQEIGKGAGLPDQNKNLVKVAD